MSGDNNNRFREDDLDFIVSFNDEDELERDADMIESAALEWALTGHCPTQEEIEAALEDIEADPDWDLPTDDAGYDPTVMNWNQYLLDDTYQWEEDRANRRKILKQKIEDVMADIEELTRYLDRLNQSLEDLEEGEDG